MTKIFQNKNKGPGPLRPLLCLSPGRGAGSNGEQRVSGSWPREHFGGGQALTTPSQVFITHCGKVQGTRRANNGALI